MLRSVSVRRLPARSRDGEQFVIENMDETWCVALGRDVTLAVGVGRTDEEQRRERDEATTMLVEMVNLLLDGGRARRPDDLA